MDHYHKLMRRQFYGHNKDSGGSRKAIRAGLLRISCVISVKSGMSGDVLSKGKYQTEELLRFLKEKANINADMVTLENEKVERGYKEDIYSYTKTISFRYQAENHMIELITSLLEIMANVEYHITFGLSGRTSKEELVLSAAVEDAHIKAEKIAASLNSKIIGFHEINYRSQTNDIELNDCFAILGDAPVPDTLGADLKMPRIKIEKSVQITWITE